MESGDIMTDPTYEAESPRYPEVAERDARFVGHEPKDETMTDDPKCEAGCISYYGGEKKHHKDCPYYPESLTKLNADRIEALLAKRDALEAELAEDEKKRADDAEAENRKLREALAQVVEMAETTKQYVKKSTPNATEEWTKGFMQGLNAAAGDVSRPARAALAEQEKTDDQ